MGGFLAVSTTDLVQSIFMTIALVVIVFFGINQAGGMGNVIANAQALPGYLDITKGYDASTGTASSFNLLSIVSTLAWGLGYFGMPHILLRFMGIRNEKDLVLSRRIAAVWCVLSMGVAILIGVIGYSVSVTGKIPMLASSSESETIIIKLADLMSQHGFIFALFAGVILSGILAATMSTADSQLLAAASSVSQDQRSLQSPSSRSSLPGIPTVPSFASCPLHGRDSVLPLVRQCCWRCSGDGPTDRALRPV